MCYAGISSGRQERPGLHDSNGTPPLLCQLAAQLIKLKQLQDRDGNVWQRVRELEIRISRQSSLGEGAGSTQSISGGTTPLGRTPVQEASSSCDTPVDEAAVAVEGTGAVAVVDIGTPGSAAKGDGASGAVAHIGTTGTAGAGAVGTQGKRSPSFRSRAYCKMPR